MPAGPRGLSIRAKVSLTLAALVLASLGLTAGFLLWQTRQALLGEAIHRGLTVGRNLADYSAGAVLERDPLQTMQFAQDALDDDAVVYAVLTDAGGSVLAVRALPGAAPASIGRPWPRLGGVPVAADLPAGVELRQAPGPGGAPLLAFGFPVVKAGVRVGHAYIGLSEAKMRAVLEATTVKALLLAAALALAALGAALALADRMVSPVRRLTRVALAVGGGDLDARVEERGSDELAVLARTFNAMTGGLKKAQADLLERQLLQQELDIAQEIQRGLLPKKVPALPGYELAAFYQPAKEVGGDLYDFIPMQGARLGLAIADVSGKSVPGSLGMAMTRSVLRAQAAARDVGVAETLRRTNAVIQPDIRRGMFVTLFYAVLDPVAHTLTCANAGHNPAYLLRGGRVAELAPEGVALGLVEPASFFAEEGVLDLRPGDLLVLYTDGVTEAMNRAREEFGEERFKRALLAAAGGPLEGVRDSVLRAVGAFVDGAPPHDDITLVLLRRSA